MTPVGRLAAIVAVALAILTVATWNDSTQSVVRSDAPLDGAMLFRAKGCASCHFGPDMNSGFSIGPSLKSAAEWAGDRRPGMSAADYLAESMRTPSAFISPAFSGGQGPMTGMPDLNLSEAEIDALVAYLLN
ncbi:MAG: cytochrome c [Ilumatobacteraceae bacterium]